jgi:hypothetical protein
MTSSLLGGFRLGTEVNDFSRYVTDENQLARPWSSDRVSSPLGRTPNRAPSHRIPPATTQVTAQTTTLSGRGDTVHARPKAAMFSEN